MLGNNENERNQQQQEVTNPTDTEFSQEVASAPNDDSLEQGNYHQEEVARGSGWGIAGIVLVILSFFLWPYLLAPIGIILGVMAVSQRSKLGWWAIAIGVIALIVYTIFMIFAIPFRILF